MVATVTIVQAYGGTDGNPSYTEDLTNDATRLQTKDQYDKADTTYPIPIPAADFNYSYWIHMCLDLAGTFTKINNVRHYSDGDIGWNYGTSGQLYRGNHDTGDDGCAMPTEYEVATGTEGTTGHAIDDATNGHSSYNTQTTKTANLASDTSVSPATIDSTDHEEAGKTKAVVIQVKVDTDATQGEQADETMTWKYDEI